MNLNELIRKNILELHPYSCARNEFQGEASVFLDANENPYNSPLNRYPDPLQIELKEQISKIKNVPVENIFTGNGSDEAIDLLYRAFCEPNHDNVVAIEPTYGMYKVCADINDVEYRKVMLNENFDIEAYRLIDATNVRSKIIWLCSPNNPTGNSLNRTELHKILKWFRGIVVIDEAYIDFSTGGSFSSFLSEYPNLVVLQTMSKAWGNAAVRLGMAYGSAEIVNVLNKIKYPYNVNILTQNAVVEALQNPEQMHEWVDKLLVQREFMIKELEKYNFVNHIYPTDANFILVKVKDANSLYKYLVKKSIIVRNRSNVSLCENCIRITIGTPQENKILLDELKRY
ncbi:MAG TPA: histidinol-phosphate transaminase [Paludibacter sp.]|nr:histidinol-phosphate transaminase [Paludibacter sp.]